MILYFSSSLINAISAGNIPRFHTHIIVRFSFAKSSSIVQFGPRLTVCIRNNEFYGQELSASRQFPFRKAISFFFVNSDLVFHWGLLPSFRRGCSGYRDTPAIAYLEKKIGIRYKRLCVVICKRQHVVRMHYSFVPLMI